MIIRWTGDTTGLDLKPTWEVESVRIHTVNNMLQPDGQTRAATMVAYFKMTADQIRKLIEEYGKESIPTNILGVNVIPLFPNAVLWTWYPPKGYIGTIKPGTYTSFEVVCDATL
jgi:hypothetical protein